MQLTKRQFLKSTLAAAAALVLSPFEKLIANLSNPHYIPKIPKGMNLKLNPHIRQIKNGIDGYIKLLKSPHYTIIPEFEDNLNNLSLAIFPKHYSPELFNSQVSLIKALPSYTNIQVITASHFKKEVEKSLESKINKPIIFYEISNCNSWLQDYCKGDSKRQIINNNHNETNFKKIQGPNWFSLPVYFEGGDVLITKNKNNESIVFVGYYSFNETEKQYRVLGLDPITENQYSEIIKNCFGAKEAHIIGNKTESKWLFHLDFIALPYKPNYIIVLDTSSLSDKETQLKINKIQQEKEQELKKQNPDRNNIDWYNFELNDLKKRSIEIIKTKQYADDVIAAIESQGFQIPKINTSIEAVSWYSSSLNGRVFKNKITNQLCFLMPEYQYGLRELNKENKRIISSLGIEVTSFKDYSAKIKHGSGHCFSNIY